MPDETVRTELREGVAVVRIDDAKANAFSHAVIDALGQALDRAEKDAGSVLLVGRPGRFSAGFDLTSMRGGAEAARGLVGAGAELFLRLFELPLPVVAACTGHALAAGAVTLLSCDLRLGARGAYKIGLNEVAIGLALPIFGVELARARLSKRHFDRAVGQAEIYAPEAAVDAGFLDRCVDADALFEVAMGEAARLAQLPQPAFRATKLRSHAEIAAGIRATLADDLKRMTGIAS
jgi:enoyl-CoA hydratase